LNFISTGGHYNQPAWKTSEKFYKFGLQGVELSGGAHDQDQLYKLKELSKKITFQIHNYFPPPETPFVFNLASLDQDVGLKSQRHVITAIQWAFELGRPVYSFHAGFLLDPRVSELGKKIESRYLFDHRNSMQVFLERVNYLAEYALELGVDLLIENNVLSNNNFMEFNQLPFLMLTADECVYVMQNTPSNVNLLVDVAHLKVTANSLKFSPVEFLVQCNKWIQAYHLSDNDGKSDSNEIMTERSWFWPYLKSDLDYYSLEIYNVSPSILSQQDNLLVQMLGKIDAKS